MKRISVLRSRLFRILTALALVACVNGTAAAGQIGFVYALQQVNGGVNFIHGFRIDLTTGALTLLPGFPMSSQGTGGPSSVSEQLAYHEGRLFVVNDGDNTLAVFSVNTSTGALTATPFSPVALGAGSWRCVDVHPSGSPVVVGNASNAMSSFVVTAINAIPAAGSPYATGSAAPYSCRFSQDGAYVYGGGSVGSTIAGFSVNAVTGVLTALAGSPFESGAGNPLALATDASGRLFSTSFNAAHVLAYTTAAGVPTAVLGNPFASGLTNGIHGLVHPAGYYMVVDRPGNSVGVFRIIGAGGVTTLSAVAGSPFTTGGSLPVAVATTPNGGHLVAAHSTSRNLSVFHVSPTTGALALLSVQPDSTLGITGNVAGLVFAPADAGFVYSITQVNAAANQIYGFRMNPNTGALTLLPGFPLATGGNGTALAPAEFMAYANGRLYVINDSSDTLSAFKVNRSTGALTPLAFSPFALPAGNQGCVEIHPSGSPVVVGLASGGVLSINVGATSATLVPGSPFGTASSFSCRFSQDGTYFYAGGNLVPTIAAFSVNAGTGVLTPLVGSPFDSGNGPVGYATDSSGLLFTAGLTFPFDLRVFTTPGGVPTAVTSNPFTSGLDQSTHGLLHPRGFYMASARTNHVIGSYLIAGTGAGTTLTAVVGSPFASGGLSTTALAATPDGTYVVAAHGASRNLTVFKVHPALGSLSSVVTQPVNTLGAAGRVVGMAFAPAVPPFIDDPLTALTSVIKAVHITELRARIDAVRAQYGLSPLAYTDPTLSVATTPVRLAHIAELRAALNEVFVALGMATPVYTDPTFSVGVTVVKLAHITELRAAVVAIE